MARLTFDTDYCCQAARLTVEVDCALHFGFYDDTGVTVTEVEEVRLGGVRFNPCEDSEAAKHWQAIAQERISDDADLEYEAAALVLAESKEPRCEEENR